MGAELPRTGCAYPGLTVRLLQNETLMDQGEVNASGAYYISDLAPGDYDWQVVNESGYIVNKDPKLINVLADLPTSHINLDLENSDADSDGDGLPDCWELEYFGNLDQVADGHGDSDDLTNIEEYNIGTNPTNRDTDSDGLSDSDESTYGTNPFVGDTDGDGCLDADEVTAGTDPTNEDTDGDGLSDSEEISYNTDPLLLDSDGDTYSDR